MAKMTKDSCNVRKVRFTLPDVQSSMIDSDECETNSIKQQQPQTKIKENSEQSKYMITTKKDENKVHGTARYINGTLNFTSTDYKTTIHADIDKNKEKITEKVKLNKISTIISRNQFTNDGSAQTQRKRISSNQSYWDNAINQRGILLHVSHENFMESQAKKKFRKNRILRYTTVLTEPTNCFKKTKTRLMNHTRSKLSPSKQQCNTLELPKENSPRTKSKQIKETKCLFNKFSYKLITVKKKKHSPMPIPVNIDELNERALSLVCKSVDCVEHELDHHCTSKQLSDIFEIAHRWQSTAKQQTTIDNSELLNESSTNSVEYCTLKKSDAKM